MVSCSRDALSWRTLASAQAVSAFPIKCRLCCHFFWLEVSIWLRLVYTPLLTWVWVPNYLGWLFSFKTRNLYFIFFTRLICHINKHGEFPLKRWCTLRSGESLSKGLPNMFSPKSTILDTLSYNNPKGIISKIPPFTNLFTIWILYLRFNTFRLKGGG